MSSRQTLAVVVLLSLVAAGGVIGWLLVPGAVESETVGPPPSPIPVAAAPEEVAVAPHPREKYDLYGEMKAVLALVQFGPIDPDPRVADEQSLPVFARFGVLRTVLRRELLKNVVTDAPGLVRVVSQLKQLNTEEAKYRQRLALAGAEWMSSRVDLPGRVGERPSAIDTTRMRALRSAAQSSNSDIAADAVATLAHLRRTQLEAMLHRIVGKDHGSVGDLVTEIVLVDGAAERLEAIDDGVQDAAQVHAAWRGELAAKFARSPNEVTPPEVAAWLLSGCHLDAKAGGASGADFAFLDPARNPALVKAVAASRPLRRLLQEWAANHDRDPAATSAASALSKATEK